jgi:hypothetical protein
LHGTAIIPVNDPLMEGKNHLLFCHLLLLQSEMQYTLLFLRINDSCILVSFPLGT